MAIKVSGTTVVDDSRNLTNIAALTLAGTANLADIQETVTALGNTGTAKTIDLSLGTVYTATLTGNCTFTVSNANAASSSFVLILTNDGSAGRTVAWSTGGTVKYPNGTVSRSTGANAVDVWFFFSPDGGSTWYASVPMTNVSA